MARIYNRSGAAGSPDEGACSTEPEQHEWQQTRSRTAETKQAASIGSTPTRRASLEVQRDAPVGNVKPSGQPHPALIALARLLARQAAAELSDAPAAGSGDDAP